MDDFLEKFIVKNFNIDKFIWFLKFFFL
jgi:hypothetical protein